MKKTIICNITMRKEHVGHTYTSKSKSIPVSDRAVLYPVNAFLEKTLEPEDELKVILLVKKDSHEYYKKNTQEFMDELKKVNDKIGASVEYSIVDTDFSEEQAVHEQLMGKLVNAFSVGDHITADITFGPKDLPVVIFVALNFAEKFLDCTVDNILYGKADFDGEEITGTQVCSMAPLYYLSSVTNAIDCNDPEKAKAMLETLIEM